MSETTRRTVLAGAAGISAAAALSACANDPETDDGTDTAAPPEQSPSISTTTSSALAVKTDIPVGGGKVFKDAGVVVTQPAAGEFKAFSSTCSHQGCTVNSVAAGTILCNCHNSKFSAADGSVQSGPAKSPLPTKAITVEGDNIVLA